jgi:hypothetical protein
MGQIPLHELIGSIAADLVRAEVLAAQASIEFIRNVGFEGGNKSSDDWGSIRYVKFSYLTYGANGKPKPRTIRVPLLTLIPVPLQQVDDTECEFFIRVVDIIPPAKGKVAGTEAEKINLTPQHATIICDIAPFGTEQTDVKQVPRIRFKVLLKQSDLPAGLSSSLRRIEETSGEVVPNG